MFCESRQLFKALGVVSLGLVVLKTTAKLSGKARKTCSESTSGLSGRTWMVLYIEKERQH